MADGEDRTGGDVLVSISSILLGAMHIGQTAPGIVALCIARSAAAKVFETIDRVPPIDLSSEDGLKFATVEGHVSFNSIVFCYVSIA